MSRVIAINQLAEAMRLNGEKQFSQALEPARAAVHEMPTSSFAHLALANTLAGLGLNDQAHQEYEKAETIAASQPEWYFLQRAEIRAGLVATGHASR
jgi:Tfp pilus assembly protein PilF